MQDNQGKPKKVGYFKYKKLEKQELGTNYSFDDLYAFTKRYEPRGLLYFLSRFPHSAKWLIDGYKIRRLKLGRQKWKDGKLYIEKIPYYISSGATDYLTAILRDYLRAYAKDAYAIGSAVFEKDGEEVGGAPLIRAIGTSGNDALEDWRKMVNDTAGSFDRAADLRAASWDADSNEDMDRLWKEYRATLVEAFDRLKVIFHDLDD